LAPWLRRLAPFDGASAPILENAMAALNVPALGASVPRRGSRAGRIFGYGVLKIGGWSFAGTIPDVAKAVIIVAPHTSNWDFVVGAAGMFALDLDLRFLGKHTLFNGPLAPVMRALGGIPVDRAHPGGGVVDEMVELFHTEEQLLLALAPEGTRGDVDRWRTGFHRIAAGAGVPIVPVALDYGRRMIRFGRPHTPTEDVAGDLARLQDYYAGATGRRRSVH